jgi:thioredoxin-related protein
MKQPLLILLLVFLSSSICKSKPGKPLVLENTISASKIVVDSKNNIYITGSFSGIASFSKTLLAIIGTPMFFCKYADQFRFGTTKKS